MRAGSGAWTLPGTTGIGIGIGIGMSRLLKLFVSRVCTARARPGFSMAKQGCQSAVYININKPARYRLSGPSRPCPWPGHESKRYQADGTYTKPVHTRHGIHEPLLFSESLAPTLVPVPTQATWGFRSFGRLGSHQASRKVKRQRGTIRCSSPAKDPGRCGFRQTQGC
ncbi:hypothetical protein EDC01DRAFT_675355 [Geopyxis carbonaria]|nr:hypothetical protein EDC01DRAFT_675355 [Geopyxis carbonaria]